MSPELKARIDFELGQLRRLLDEGQNLIALSKLSPPDNPGRWALAAMLQAFYNGIENILKQIAIAFDGKLAKSDQWHADLLALLGKPTGNRSAVISTDMAALLKKYLGFRHVFRNIYTHELRWESMSDLVWQTDNTLSKIVLELNTFLNRIA